MYEMIVVQYDAMFPENATDFQKGMILLDEAVGFFMKDKDNPLSRSFEDIIGLLVRGYEGEKDE